MKERKKQKPTNQPIRRQARKDKSNSYLSLSAACLFLKGSKFQSPQRTSGHCWAAGWVVREERGRERQKEERRERESVPLLSAGWGAEGRV